LNKSKATEFQGKENKIIACSEHKSEAKKVEFSKGKEKSMPTKPLERFLSQAQCGFCNGHKELFPRVLLFL